MDHLFFTAWQNAWSDVVFENAIKAKAPTAPELSFDYELSVGRSQSSAYGVNSSRTHFSGLKQLEFII